MTCTIGTWIGVYMACIIGVRGVYIAINVGVYCGEYISRMIGV